MLSIRERGPVCWSSNADKLGVLASLLKPPDWHADALCKEYPDLPWFPERGEPSTVTRAVCARCTVRAECLAAGLEGDEKGIWGGTTGRERKRTSKIAA